MIYLTIYLSTKEKLKDAWTLSFPQRPSFRRRPVGRRSAPSWRPLWRLRRPSWWRLWRGRRGLDARTAHAGPGRPAAGGAGAHRRGATAWLRDHQAARGEDGGLVQPQPRHRLSDANVPGGSGLRDR